VHCFYFFCADGSCNSFKVFRAQLPKENPYYTAEDKEEDIKLKDGPNAKHAPLCEVCGCLGPKQCGHCHAASYCSREHQAVDWKYGHNEVCKKIQQWQKDKKGDMPVMTKYPSHFLFKEFELVTDPEPDEGDELGDEERDELLQKYEAYKAKDIADPDIDEEGSSAGLEVDKTFKRFSKRIQREPGQVLRYSRAAEPPLWVNDKGQAQESDIPPCPHCKSARIFEFQILPQLLYYLKLDNSLENTKSTLDWGTLVVYACVKSCSEGAQKGWAEEVTWVQAMH